MKKNEAIKIIVRLEKNPYTGKMDEVLFLPNTPAKYGMIAYCSPKEGHGEATLEYYRSTKPVKGRAAAMWATWYSNYGGGGPVAVEAYQRINYDDLHQAWGI